MSSPRTTVLLLNIGHGLDHLFLLVFASAVGTMAADFGLARWEDLMPYSLGAFVMFGLGSMPAGWLGDHWSRRSMMVVFFVGIGLASIAVAFCTSIWQLALALTVLGVFAAIYHPVGIAMLIQNVARNVGFTIGVNGLAGNLGVAAAAVVTGFLVQAWGWRVAFVVPGVVSILCGIAFALVAPAETMAASKRPRTGPVVPPAVAMRVFLVMTLVSTCTSLLFNFTTNGNAELFRERLAGITSDPARLGVLLGIAYVFGSFAQLAVGRLIDRMPLRTIFLPIALLQIPIFLAAAWARDWTLFGLAIAFMVLVFGQIPFADALVARYFDDRMRSRVFATRMVISFGASSAAVGLLGPLVRGSGFSTLFLAMAAVALCTALLMLLVPERQSSHAAAT